MTRNCHHDMHLMRTSWVRAVSSRSRVIVTTSRPDRSDGNKSMAIEGCSMAPPTTEIDARPLPLCDALPRCWVRGVFLSSPACLCVPVYQFVCVCVCERVCVTPKTAVLVRAQTRGSCPPYPKAKYLPLWKFIKACCVCIFFANFRMNSCSSNNRLTTQAKLFACCLTWMLKSIEFTC